MGRIDLRRDVAGPSVATLVLRFAQDLPSGEVTRVSRVLSGT